MTSLLRILLGFWAGAVLFLAIWLGGATLLVGVGLPGVPHSELGQAHRWLMVMVIAPAGGLVSGWVARALARSMVAAIMLALAVALGMIWLFWPDMPILGLIACVASALVGGWLGKLGTRAGVERPCAGPQSLVW